MIRRILTAQISYYFLKQILNKNSFYLSRIDFGHQSVSPGNYTLKFSLRNGLGNVSLDNITITSTPEMKSSLELYKEWSRTTTTTSSPTTTVNRTSTSPNATTQGSSTSSRGPSTTNGNTTGGGATNSPWSEGRSDTSQIVLIVLLVVVSASLVGLSLKHYQTQKKLREYRVTRNVGQNFDNPLYSGQHTPADRYGSLQN